MVVKRASISSLLLKEGLVIVKNISYEQRAQSSGLFSIERMSNNNNIEYLIFNISYNIDCSIRLMLDGK